MYVCNCNGIRERQVRAVIAAGASRPADVFKAHQCKPQCARCVCEMREMTDERRVQPLPQMTMLGLSTMPSSATRC